MTFYDHNSQKAPAFFFKDVEEGIDDVKSTELGYPVPRFITYIYITAYGQKGGASEFVAADFLQRKKREADAGLYDGGWVKQFEDAFAAFKAGKELPVNGIPTATYKRIAEKRREALAYKYPTLEDLASVPDSALIDIGLDGRNIRDLARAEVQSRKDLSPLVKELADANETIRRQEETLARLSERLDLLESAKSKKKSLAEVE